MANGKINFRVSRKLKTVEIPELECSITLAALTVGQMRHLKEGDESNIARQLAMAMVDPETGGQIYDPDNADDIDNLNAMPLSIFSPLIDALNELNGRVTNDVEETKKNLMKIRSLHSASA